MSDLIAFCGLDCAACKAYQLTQANDVAAMQVLLDEWRVTYQAPDMPIEAVTCDGCTSTGRHGGYCMECPVRACAVEREVVSCALCEDYGCEKLQNFMAMAPEVKINLEAIRAKHGLN